MTAFGGAWASVMVGRVRDLFWSFLHDISLSQYGAALVFVLFGLFMARLIYVALVGIMDLLRFDKIAEHAGVYALLENRFNDVPSRLIGRVAYWITLAFFLGAAIDVLQIVDVTQRLESFAGMTGRILSFAIIIILGDILGRFIGTAFDIVLGLVDHPFAGRSATILHVTTVMGTAITNLDILGLDLRTDEGALLIGLLALSIVSAALILIVFQAKRFWTQMRIAERFRVGDRIALPDGRIAVIRELGADHLAVATDEDEWLMPAAWVLDSPVRKEDL